MNLLLTYFILALGISFLCSVMEAVLLSTTPSYISIANKAHPRAAGLLKSFKHDVETPLSAILSLNTIAHTIGAAEVGAQAQTVFGSTYVAIISAVLTFLILVFSEIIPKTIGATYWRSLLVPSAYIIQGMVYCMFPFTILSRFLSRLVSKGNKQSLLSREELNAQIDIGINEGILNNQESVIIKNTIAFRSLHAGDIMTPRTVLISCSENDTPAKILGENKTIPVSRILIHTSENQEEIIGYALKSDLQDALSNGAEQTPVSEYKRPIMHTPASIRVDELLKRFLREHNHIAVLCDEYGGLAGIATLEDVIETLLGTEIIDEADIIGDMQRYAREKWRNRAIRLGLLPANRK